MRLLKTLSVVVFLFLFSINLLANNNSDLSIKVTRISDKIILLSTEYGSGPQIALASSKGLVVMSTLWSKGIANRYRSIIEREFQRNDFAYVINNWDRLDVVGGNPVYADAIIIAHENCYNNLLQKKEDLSPHLKTLIDMWQWKAGLSQGRLEKYEPDYCHCG